MIILKPKELVKILKEHPDWEVWLCREKRKGNIILAKKTNLIFRLISWAHNIWRKK